MQYLPFVPSSARRFLAPNKKGLVLLYIVWFPLQLKIEMPLLRIVLDLVISFCLFTV